MSRNQIFNSNVRFLIHILKLSWNALLYAVHVSILLLFFLLFGKTCSALAQTTVFINEIHYDNAGADQNEGVEIAGPAGTNLTGWSIVLYNGDVGVVYKTINLSNVIPDQGIGFGTLEFFQSSIQNGAPDGMALVDNLTAVRQFLSYEGSFTATDGPANGMTSTDIGVSESSSTDAGFSLQLGSTGSVYENFAWNPPVANTFGAVNTGQTFSGGGDAAPSINSTSPSNGETNIVIDVNIVINFSEDVTVTGSWYSITGSTSGAHTATVSGGPQNYTLNPDADFSNAETITVTIFAASVTDNDTDDPPDNMTSDYTFSFTIVAAAGNWVINEIHADPAFDLAGDANGDGTRDTYDDEFVEIVNTSVTGVDISGWTLSDGASVRHTFPAATVIPNQCAIVVFGGGTPTGSFGNVTVQTASSGQLGLNNDGDTVTLNNGTSDVVSYTYGSEGGDDQSLTRDPDITGSDPLVKHSIATGSGGALFSPGTKIDGSEFSGCSGSSAPTVTTDAATAVGNTSATLKGTVNANNASTIVTFEYGLTTAYGTTVTADENPVTGSTNTAVSKVITGLTIGITYHYRAVGQNASGTTNGADMTFITGTPTTYTISGQITVNGTGLDGVTVTFFNVVTTETEITSGGGYYSYTVAANWTGTVTPSLTGYIFTPTFATIGSVTSNVTQNFSGEQQTGTIIIEKQTIPDGAPHSFTFTGEAAGNISDGQQIVVSGLQPGTYTSTETVLLNWNLTSIVCSDGNSSGDLNTQTVTFQLEAGETVTAIFTNEQQVTGITLSFFTANVVQDGILTHWTTETEPNNAGFNIFRSTKENGNYSKINESLIQSQGDATTGSTYSYLDKPEQSGDYYYKLQSVSLDGSTIFHGPVFVGLTSVDIKKYTVPDNYTLSQNYPNPFNPGTRIEFGLPKAGFVELTIYDVNGKLVKTLISGNKAAGHHFVQWHATDEQGNRLSSGVYFYQMKVRDLTKNGTGFMQTNKMILMK